MSAPLPEETGAAPKLTFTDQVKTALQTILTDPQGLPELTALITPWVEANPPLLPISQIFGYQQYVQTALTTTTAQITDSLDTFTTSAIADATFANATMAEIIGEDDITATSYAPGPTPGPELTGLPAGGYLLLYGVSGQVNGGQQLLAAPSINSGTPEDTQAVEIETSVNGSFCRGIVATLTAGSTVELQYRVGGSDGTVRYRWLFALKFSS